MTPKALLVAVAVSLLALHAPTPAAADAPGAPAAVKHRVMLIEYADGQGRLLEVSPEGKAEWEYPLGKLGVIFHPLPNGNVLFAHSGAAPTGAREVSREKKIVWEYVSQSNEVLGCERLPNGNTLLGEQRNGGDCRAVEVDKDGKIVSTVKLTTQQDAAHRQVRCVHRLENGNTLAAHEGDAAVREVDKDGKLVWEYPGVENVFEALRLPGGNTLIGCGTQKRVIEVTPDKKIVWELKAEDVPEVNLVWVTSLQVLKNGNYVIANFLRGQEGKGIHAFEVNKEKKIVWKFADHAMVKSLTMVRVLDDK